MTSNRERLRETVARSDVQQSPSELVREIRGPALEEKERRQTLLELHELPAIRDQRRDVEHEMEGSSRKAPAPEAVHTVEPGQGNSFTFAPNIRRQGVFGNCQDSEERWVACS